MAFPLSHDIIVRGPAIPEWLPHRIHSVLGNWLNTLFFKCVKLNSSGYSSLS